MAKEKRRSDRILLTIPLLVEGQDNRGRAFQSDAKTLVLNRHGGRIRANRRLHAGQTVLITNMMGRVIRFSRGGSRLACFRTGW